MLQYRTVHPETLELLNRLMKYDKLQDFFLVGGTSLADPISTNNTSWEQVKSTIVKKVNQYI